MIMDGAKHGTVVLADKQTRGRGRLNRNFFSPAETGIYMSVILIQNKTAMDSLMTTVAAAVAVCRAIGALTNQKPEIKWVNDIFIAQKKICGILAEAASNSQSGIIPGVVVGIGINVKTQDEEFPADLRLIAGSLFPKDISRNQLAAEVLNQLFFLCSDSNTADLILEYKARSMILGKIISFVRGENKYTAKAVDINEKGNLIVANEKGESIVIQSGEITIVI